MAKPPSNRVPSKSEVLANIAASTGLSRKQVGAVFDALSEGMKQALGKKGPGTFTVPGLMKVTVVQKRPVKARKGINPFTQQEQMFKAKPARKVIKVRPLKSFNEFVFAGRAPKYQCDANGEYKSTPYCDEHQSPCHRVS